MLGLHYIVKPEGFDVFIYHQHERNYCSMMLFLLLLNLCYLILMIWIIKMH